MADSDIPSLEELANDLASATSETDVKEEVAEVETAPEEPSPDETKEVEEVEAETEETEGEEGTEPDPAEEEPEVAPTTKADERKQQLSNEIRDLVSQRRDLMQEVERLNAKAYAPQSVDDLTQEINPETGDYYSRLEARVVANEQRTELSEYNTRVAEAQLVINTESQRVLQDFPMFDPSSSDYKQEVAEQAAELLRSNLLVDQNTGQITGSNISPYQLYKTIASANQASAVENQIKGQRNTEQMLAAAEPQSSATPVQPKEDNFLKGLLGEKYAKE